ncbi:hypothetical protein V495_07982, partial [Pseudogymnoascus sp. VKM F-4514 (FW-929)]
GGGGAHSAGPFDSRAAEAAFQSATNGPAGGGGNFYQQQQAQQQGESDPFAFLSSGISGLAMSGDARQNGAAAGSANKSPA